MDFKATYRYAKISPRKARLVIDQIRGKQINKVWDILHFNNCRASSMVQKVLRSVQANAEMDGSVDVDDLVVKEAFANEGPTLKRWRARARGMATEILKRRSHIHIVLSDGQEKETGTEE